MVDEFLNPEKVLFRLDFRDHQVIADFGCGRGEWVITLARRFKEAKIYAVDLLDEPLVALQRRLEKEGIENVEIKKANVEKNSLIYDNICDWVLMTNLLFEIEDLDGVFKEAKRILRPGGRILVVDWKEKVSFGPEKPISKEKIINVAKEKGLELKEEFEAGRYHFGLIFQKK